MKLEEIWNINKVEQDIRAAFAENSETKLLALLKDNSSLVSKEKTISSL